MKNRIIILLAFILGGIAATAQNSFRCLVLDGESRVPLLGASIFVEKTKQGISTDSTGSAVILNLSNGAHTIRFSMVGHTGKTIRYVFPAADTTAIIMLDKPVEATEEEVIVSSSRTESGIENLPTRVEVLGAEEVNEEVGIKPGNIASLLGDVAGIQIQQTSAATGNAEMRVQGLPGKYTQLLKDGMPLFGGYSGSFSILQVPPLDLKQIEIVKGASSTLYGGGAIAGMVNLISKRPRKGVFEKTILLNQSTLKESNANIYLSNRKNKTGYTFFSGGNYQRPVDVNKDGFSDVPDTKSFFVHPALFLYPDEKNMIYFGYNGVFENRKGGDMQVLKQRGSPAHQYFVSNQSARHSVDGYWENKINAGDRLVMKGTGSWFDRDIKTNVFGMKAKQLSWFTEASYLKKWKANDLVAGLNLTGESFRRKQPDSLKLNNYDQTTIGVFIQNDWRITSKFIIQSGMRVDHHNQYGNLVLPRLSFLYRISQYFTSRLGGGLGYKIPTVFSSEIDERDYGHVLPLNNVKAERSAGGNWDINYHQKVNGWNLTANQTLFINRINHPLISELTLTNDFHFINASDPIVTKGFETYIQVLHNALEIYLGYIYTSARKLYDNRPLSLIAKNKFATVISYEIADNFRAGIESAYTGNQFLDNGKNTPGYLFMAAMARFDVKQFAFVLNCENLLDYRQTKKEAIVNPPWNNPYFNQLWAPIDGRVINFSVRITF